MLCPTHQRPVYQVTRNEELLLGGLGLALVAYWQRRTIMTTIVDPITRGKRLSYTTVGVDGVVPDSPEDLADQAGQVLGRDVPQELYDLARMVRSEGAEAGRLRVHVALNDAAEHNWSAHFVTTYSTNPHAAGKYGEQFTPASRAPGGVRSVRRYSTARDPYEGDLLLVERVLLERAEGIDPTDVDGSGIGGVKFIDRDSLGSQDGADSYEAIAASWGNEGLRPFNVPGYPDELVVFRRTG